MANSSVERAASSPTRRFGDWLDFDLPDLFRWFDERRPTMAGAFERIKVEEEMADGVLHIRAEVPGIDPDKDAEVTVQDGVLQLKVERRQESKSEEEGRIHSEFRYGSFYRAIPLPKGSDTSALSANYKDGILEVTVPVAQPAAPQAQKVAINRA